MKDHAFGNWQVISAAECGGNLACVRWCGHDIMHGFSHISQWQDAPTNYGFPVLFPPNRIADGTFCFMGKTYHLPINEPERGNHLHGIALREAWEYGECGGDSVNMFLEFNDASPMYAGFPFDCKLSVTYTFTGDSMIQDLAIENKSDSVMPCAVGFHSAFSIPETVFIHGKGKRIETVPPRYLVSGREIEWQEDGFQPNRRIVPEDIWPFGHFRMDAQRLAELDYGDFKVEYHLDDQFDHWMVWRPEQAKHFLCIEPMNIRVGCFENTPEKLPVLAPGARRNFISRITVIH